MKRLLMVPTMLLLASATPPPDAAPIDIASILQFCGGDVRPVSAVPAVLSGYGPGGFTIGTKSAEAQAFFSNGMQLAHAFAHGAATAAFAEARRLDPDCAMCAWGHAWSLGATINYSIDDAKATEAAAVTAIAEKLAANAPERDRKLIAALKLRYEGARAEGNKAFAEAMDALVKAYPADDAILTLAADARMIGVDWSAETMARPVGLLETVLKRNPEYAPAIHFYIHATEGAGYPEKAESYADQLGRIAPAASHLIHMPSHTYYLVGRYRDAARVNLSAYEIDRAALVGTDSKAFPMMYHRHNIHFGLGGALMAGDAEAGLALARPLIASGETAKKIDIFPQLVTGHAYVTLARMGPPQEMLKVARPDRKNEAAMLLWHYARGEAFARLGDLNGVRKSAAAIAKIDKAEKNAPWVARSVLEGRIATLRGDHARAAAHYRAATIAEEAAPLGTSADPPDWWFPVRRSLAAALLASGDAEGAVREATASLARRPKDPVALAVRAEALGRLGKSTEAAKDAEAARKGWSGDVAALRAPLA